MASHYGEHGMGNSLRDALLEVGLVSEKRPEKARRPKRGKARAGQQRKQAPAQSGGEQLPAPSRHVLRENQRRTARFVRDSTLGGGSVAENAKRALRRKIEALITASRLNDGQADVAYHFVKGKRIKRIYVTEAQRAELARQMLSRGWRNSLRNRSRAAGFLYVRLSRGLAKREVRVPTADDLPRDWPATERALQAFLAAAGTRPVSIWYLPATTEWDDRVWSAAQSKLGLAPRDRYAIRDAVRDWAEAQGVPFLDLTAALAGRDSKVLCYKHDGHWNAAGHAIVADALIARAASHRPRVP